MAKYSVNQKVSVWWRGECHYGYIMEILHEDFYRVRLCTGETCLRLECDIEA